MIGDDEIKVTKFCFACKEKGFIIVRILDDENGTRGTQNRMNMCHNPKCFRYMVRAPKNWKIENYANEHSNHIHNKRGLGVHGQKSVAKSKTHKTPTMDRTRTEIRSMESARRSIVPGRNEESSDVRNDHQESRTERKAVLLGEGRENTNGYNDQMEQ